MLNPSAPYTGHASVAPLAPDALRGGRRAPTSSCLPRPRRGSQPCRLAVAVLMTLGAAAVSAAELSLMSAGAVEAGLVRVMDAFRRESGHTVTVQYGTGPQLTERLAAGQASDVLIAPANVMDRAVADGRVVASTRVVVGRVGIGVMTRPDGATPDVSSPDALKRALLAADRVVYTRGSSGQYVDTLLVKMGVRDALEARLFPLANGEAAIDAIASGSATAIGFGAITEIRSVEPKVRLVGPLPAAIQNLTTYDGAVRMGVREPAAAAAFLRFVTTPAAKQLFMAAGVQ